MPPSGSLVAAPPPRRATVDASDDEGAFDYADTNALIVAELQHDVVRLQGARPPGCAARPRHCTAQRAHAPTLPATAFLRALSWRRCFAPTAAPRPACPAALR
jgi:hypothetical protein